MRALWLVVVTTQIDRVTTFLGGLFLFFLGGMNVITKNISNWIKKYE